jgi:hypothetical protein
MGVGLRRFCPTVKNKIRHRGILAAFHIYTFCGENCSQLRSVAVIWRCSGKEAYHSTNLQRLEKDPTSPVPQEEEVDDNAVDVGDYVVDGFSGDGKYPMTPCGEI